MLFIVILKFLFIFFRYSFVSFCLSMKHFITVFVVFFISSNSFIMLIYFLLRMNYCSISLISIMFATCL